MGDLARWFNLSSDLLLPVVTARLGSRIRGRLQGGLLFTPAFIARVKASASMPTTLHCMSSKRHQRCRSADGCIKNRCASEA